ncbi:MAG: DUF3606 domain-containing protein [Comamonadaceae bacterium]|nr:MAG: DUF3606 domain-containing protein [Comamonadaceae bacterium]
MDPTPSPESAERIDLNDQAACERWAKKLNVTNQQMREAVQAVGGKPGDVEMHLKGTRSTSNDERVEQVLQAGEGEVR